MADLVSVIVPVFNGRDYLAQAIESAFAQTHPAIEIVAVDDGSTDGSADILASYAPRITVVTQTNAGPSAARNRGVAHSSGDYLAFLDGDDLWDPDKTGAQLASLKAHPKAVAIYCDHRSIDASGQVLGLTGALEHPRSSGNILEDLIRGQRIKSPSFVMVRRAAFDAVGGFDESLRYAEDYDLWVRLAMIGPILYQLDTLASYRVHGGNVSLGPGSGLKVSEGILHALEKLAFQRPGVDAEITELARQRLYSTALHLGWAQRQVGAPWKAAQAYRRALGLRPTSSKALLGLLSSLFSVAGGAVRER
jgi:glycosyltransferase involved in cell wall biosynthesis